MSFDAVVMLTWSNWFTEMRANRYHYATRFAKKNPVIFVQPDLNKAKFYFEESGYENITILHIHRTFNENIAAILNKALLTKKIIKPLLWVYNVNFCKFVVTKFSPLKVYHATEDYFSDEFHQNIKIGEEIKQKLLITLMATDLLVSVSEGVQASYCQNGQYKGEKILLANGCDFDFYRTDLRQVDVQDGKKNVALYQGNISDKLDYELLIKLIAKMPDWDFWFCGRAEYLPGWKKVLTYKNVSYFGCVPPEKVKELSYQATVGLIPFLQNNLIIERTFPLKAFEYIACGLPVVTIPIKALLPYNKVFNFAQSVDEFANLIRVTAQTRYQKQAIQNRLEEANKHSYNRKFELLLDKIMKLTR